MATTAESMNESVWEKLRYVVNTYVVLHVCRCVGTIPHNDQSLQAPRRI